MADNLANFTTDLLSLNHKLLLPADHFFLGNATQVLKLLQLLGQFGLDLGEDALVLELVEALHDDVLWYDVLNPHHIEKHVVA